MNFEDILAYYEAKGFTADEAALAAYIEADILEM